MCTGSSPLLPPIPGLADVPYLTNENVWDTTQLPSSILFIRSDPHRHALKIGRESQVTADREIVTGHAYPSGDVAVSVR